MTIDALREPQQAIADASFSGRRWRLRAAADDAVAALMRSAGIGETLARILAGRGVSEADLPDWLEPTLRRLLPDPACLKDMDKALERLMIALERNETIAIFGDYDVDGSASSALLGDYLKSLGKRPRLYIPDRMTEGYGPSAGALRQLRDEGAGLVVTVDCGAGAHAALDAARACGLDVIVLDHHRIERPPPAVAHVNPNQPGDTSGLGHLCAASVVFLFLVGLNRALRAEGWFARHAIAEPDLRSALDLVALATICDVVPLLGVNRAFVRAGLARLGSRPGIAALAAVAGAGPPFTPYHLGFVFGPRINAGGRVGRCSLGAELLGSATQADAEPLARALDRHNKERQAIEAIILEEAMALAQAAEPAPFLLVAGEGWHAGVVGIVAGRLKERFGKPAFVAGLEGGMGRGSARSVAGIDVGAAIRAAHEAGRIDGGGGHAMAAGFALRAEQLDGLRDFLVRWFAGHASADTGRELLLDVALSAGGATPALIEDLARIGPFGAGNAEPVCAILDAAVVFADVVGQNHVRLRLAGADGTRLDAIAFRTADAPLGQALLQARGRRIHAAGALRLDHWQGRARVQLQIEDAAPAGL